MFDALRQFEGMSIQELEKHILSLPAKVRSQLEEWVNSDLSIWRPLPGPQAAAYYSAADIIGYGGAAGGGKTDLMVGMCLTRHRKSLVCRKDGMQLFGVRERIASIMGGQDGWNGQDRVWRHSAGVIQMRGLPHPGDEKKLQGQDHGLKGFDEATEMLEHQVRFIMGWMRSDDPAVKPQALMTFNPPTTIEGRWVISYFGPWLDKKHRNRAKDGEIRLFTTIGGVDFETEDDRPFILFGAERVYDFDPEEHSPEKIITPKTRTFIHSKVSDNPYYLRTGYVSTLQAMPEPLRSQMLLGDFEAGMEDDRWQVIPTKWVEAAMDRWRPRDAKGDMDSMGVDPAMGGSDKFVISRRHGIWFDDLLRYPGSHVPDGPTGAGLVILARRDRAPVHVDVVGWGASTYDFLKANDVQALRINGAEKSLELTVEGGLKFANMRAQLIWRMREALAPTARFPLELPDDSQLLNDLTAYRWRMTPAGILIESKEDMRQRLGRSPDDGDAVCNALIATIKDQTVFDHLVEHMSAGGYDRFSELND